MILQKQRILAVGYGYTAKEARTLAIEQAVYELKKRRTGANGLPSSAEMLSGSFEITEVLLNITIPVGESVHGQYFKQESFEYVVTLTERDD